METKHTPEPWEWFSNPHEEVAIAAVDGGCTIALLGCKELDPDCAKEVNEADAARIVDCVNSCKGINPEAVPDLLEALKAVMPLIPGHLDDDVAGRPWLVAARAAIAKATQQPNT